MITLGLAVLYCPVSFLAHKEWSAEKVQVCSQPFRAIMGGSWASLAQQFLREEVLV